MPPSTTSPQITAEGRAAAGRIAEFRENLNNGATIAQARRNVRAVTNPGMATSATPGQITPPTTQINRTGFRVQTPDTFAVETATGAPTRNEVLDRRAQMEQEQTMRTNLTQGYDALMGRIGTVSSPFVNPEETINRLLLNRPTETQTALDEARAGQARTTRGFVGGLEQAGEQAREEFGVADLQSSLAETRNRIAERTNQLRTTLRDFETNAKRRGVAREFVDAEKRKVQADAAAELADLAIIESAQLGNLTEARNEIDRVLDQKIQAYQFENQAIEQEIARLQAMDTREADRRSEQLQIALQERNRQIEQTIANERETRDYMAQAAANGADTGTLDAIRKAATPGEAALLAGPWIGRIDRMQAEASMAASYASAAASRTNRLLALAEAGDPNAIKELKFDPRSVEVELDPTTKRQLEEQVNSTGSLLKYASRYKKIIDDFGFTNQNFGDPALLGEISTLRGLMTAEYKRAETLGTLDAGLITLMDSILGAEPTSSIIGWGPEGSALTNATGRKSNRLSSQIGTFIDSLTNKKTEAMLRLGINPTTLPPEDEEEIDMIMGGTNTTTPMQGGFNPATYFSQ